MIQSCSRGNNYETTSQEDSLTLETIIFDVIQKSDLYSEPNENSNKLINQKATQFFKEVHYLSIDKTCKVLVLETNDDWSKIQVSTPQHLKESHIGWVKTNILREHKEEPLTKYEENKDYQILYSKDGGTVENYYVLLLWEKFDEDSLEKLANFIQREKATKKECNIYIYDSKDIVPLMEKYPIKGKEYVKVADHFVYMLSFDGMGIYYPFIDSQYKKYGGKKTK